MEQEYEYEYVSDKSYIVAILLCFFFGYLGIHRFYAGKIFTGVLQLFTGGGFGIWWIFDLIMIILGRFKDKNGYYIKN